ncbi:AAA-domain-containing protein [Mytilinidion resinicola]|uniref:Peroxisomal ATPase PEX1 n=1 Tax=Mytilinidion resinicola TaxID=574789 RepID=A0A6A6YR45_9PEZI|nr:AAA-domain-containing protein [Mytilinidion resinicola]KAF2810435.1 AAA-domain-containing protein [Mytilinidion resinicola]
MAPAVKRPGGQAVQAEVALIQSLKHCLVNLPGSLVSVLVNANTIAQNVVVELNYRQPPPPGADAKGTSPVQKSVFAGWTGMQSKRKLASVVGRDGLSGSRGSAVNRDQDVAVVEVDATYGRLLGLVESQKVGILLHVDPPQAHTINIEPLTPVDWEMIELHAQFLELNFLAQIRALPNPAYTPPSESQRQPPHPLALHLSPTTTANIIVTSVSPAPPPTSAFVKISPDAEVIVAPKTRQKSERSSGRESRSVGGTSRRSAGGKSSASTVRRRSGRDEASSKGALFLRGVDREIAGEWFDEEEDEKNEGLKVWVDRDMLLTRELRGVTWVLVSVVKPAGLQEPVDVQKEQENEKPTNRVIARIQVWEDAPDSRHIALSSPLCQVLCSEQFVGGLVRIEGAPTQVAKPSSMVKPPGSKDAGVKAIKVLPFASTSSQLGSNLKFGGESKQEREEASQRIKRMYGKGPHGVGLLDGPITDGMILPPLDNSEKAWQGGIVRFEPPQQQSADGTKSPPAWFLGSERKFSIEVLPEIIRPSNALRGLSSGEPIPDSAPTMVGIDPLIEQLTGHLSHNSSVLLTGGLGAGKSGLTHLLAHSLRSERLFNVTYFPCRKLVMDETRVSTIKDTLNRLFSCASWGARLGGRAVVILDDLDRLCPVETELQVGGENGRSRHISEGLCSIVKQYCSIDSGVVLLATAQSKEALNNVIIGGHVVREIVSLKAPNKEGRRRVLEMLVHKDAKPATDHSKLNGYSNNDDSILGSSTSGSRPSTSGQYASQPEPDADGFVVDPSIDFLDLAGLTDGYMPGDLVLLNSRARSEALIRSVSSSYTSIVLSKDDFTTALAGFTPASLRNVTLQSSTTRWDSIGGLHSTRQTLLETLQYPTTYAPIFAQCPLRLRSGLLLYGYPGCGKTLLASAVAGECGLNFISVKGPEILNKYIGASEKSVRDLFERAEAARPCVLFFDEFDSIAPKRGHDSTGVTDRVVNQLLTQMDGAEGLSGVYVLAATSRPDLIDPALLRPGRLDKSLICDLPGLDERIDILTAVTRKLRLAPSVLTTGHEGENLREIAQRTEGYSGADLQAVVYNAQLEAIHDVLGDHVPEIGEDSKAKKGANGTVAKSSKSDKSATPDFVHFRFGDSIAATGDSAVPSSVALTERATIAAKLASLQAIRRKQKLANHQHGQQDTDGAGSKEEPESKEPEIQWPHIKSSLASTRSSISEQERRRLAGIYREFVVGRNGEMPSGQGGSEIGGRSSLM